MNPLLRVIEWLDTGLEQLVEGERTTRRNRKQAVADLEEAKDAAKCVVALLTRNARLILREEKKQRRLQHQGLLEGFLAEKNYVDRALDSARRTLAKLEARLLEARRREQAHDGRREVALAQAELARKTSPDLSR